MKEKLIYLYYLVLLLVLVSWTDPSSSPAMAIRLAYMTALFVPTIFWQRSWLPAVFTCFVSISQYGISYSYLPDSIVTYLWIILFLFVLYRHREKISLVPVSLMLLPLYVFIIDFITSGTIFHVSYVLAISCLMFYLFDKDYSDSSNKMSLAFIIITVTLCYYFLFFKDTFSQSLGKYDTDLERVLWTDPNYLGCLIGMGVMCCITRVRDTFISNYLRILLYIIIGVAIAVMVMNASRGALVAVSCGLVYYLLVSKTKMLYKILFTALIIGFLYYLYNNSYFDLLLYRIQGDETGSGRSEIWISRLEAFFSGSIFNMIWGYGHEGCMTLGTSFTIGNHNDYIAFLVEYGFIGLSLFLSTLLYPLKKIKEVGGDSTHVVASVIYLATCCFSLEPLTLGRIPYYMFYIYILMLVNSNYRMLKK